MCIYIYIHTHSTCMRVYTYVVLYGNFCFNLRMVIFPLNWASPLGSSIVPVGYLGPSAVCRSPKHLGATEGPGRWALRGPAWCCLNGGVPQ